MAVRLIPRLLIILLLSFSSTTLVLAQYFQLNDNKKKVKLPFKMVRNMVIVKLTINEKGPFNFILDTGVGLMIITEPALLDSLNLTSKRSVKITGLGNNEDYGAYYTNTLAIKMPGISSVGVAAAIFKEDHFGLSNYTGIPICGLLGYEFFNRLAVKLNFNDSTLTAYRPEALNKVSRYEKIPIAVENNKPYMTAGIRFCDNTEHACKLIVDIGAGHSLSLDNGHQWPTENAIAANLGMGLTGPINGEISRVNHLVLGRYKLNNVLSSFPETKRGLIDAATRDGNLGMDVLKRFTVIFDYQNGMMYLKARTELKEPFEHDMSGLEYFAGGNGYSHVFISRVEPGSAGDDVGLEQNDELVLVNFKPVSKMSLEDIDRMFRSGDGRGVLVQIFHNNVFENVLLTLKRRI